jgi:diguanylate cyclase (GGDEF)-like protein
MGQAVGVLHATGENHHPPSTDQTEQLSLIASKTSERIGMLRAFEQSQSKATTDALTGLANRRHLETPIHELQRDEVPYALAYIDLDHFKQLNDTHGHETGDRALRLFSRVLRETLRPTDHAGRWGGEEFLVILPRAQSRHAEHVMQRLATALDNALKSADTPHFTLSVGISDSTQHATFKDMLAAADNALMAAKHGGRNGIRRADEPVRSDAPADDPAQQQLDMLFHGTASADKTDADQVPEPEAPTGNANLTSTLQQR